MIECVKSRPIAGLTFSNFNSRKVLYHVRDLFRRPIRSDTSLENERMKPVIYSSMDIDGLWMRGVRSMAYTIWSFESVW
jgi:hypothetical protein